MEAAQRLADQLIYLCTLGVVAAITLLITFPGLRHASSAMLATACLFAGVCVGLLMRFSRILSFSPTIAGRNRNAVGRFGVVAQAVLFLAGLGALSKAAWSPQQAERASVKSAWHTTARGITEGISGLALVEHTARHTILLAAHDNKAPGEKRLSLLTWRPPDSWEARLLAWPGENPPIDLEAIAHVSDRPGEFILFASSGEACVITLAAERDAITVQARFAVPNAGPTRQFEGFDLQKLGSSVVACWGDRGDSEAPTQLFWAMFDSATRAFGKVESANWRVPWPVEHQRHVSDLRILNTGTLLITASSDPGDDGPFAGAIYIAGTLNRVGERTTFSADPAPTRIFATTDHKIEAIAFVPGPTGGIFLGADNENRGGAVHSGLRSE